MEYIYRHKYYILAIVFAISIYIYIYFNYDLNSGWINYKKYPELKHLMDNKYKIKRELDSIIKLRKWNKWGDNYSKTKQFTSMSHEEIKKKISKHTHISNEKSWKLFGLILNQEILPNSEQCPNTMNLLKDIGLENIINAGFSCLEAGATTKRHKDLNKSFYRCHIPLIIPEGDCYLEVNDIKKKWDENQPLVFDDTQYHNAWNYTNKNRFILIIDLKRR